VTDAQKPGFCAGIGDEPQGYFQKPGFSPTLRKACIFDFIGLLLAKQVIACYQKLA
jgi:hypothetical protein